MRAHLSLISLASLLVACAAPRPLPRAPLAPPPSDDRPAVRSETREPAASPAPRRAVRSAEVDTPAPPVYRSFVEVVEVPVPVAGAREVVAPDHRDHAYEAYLDRHARGRYRVRQTNPFPVNTAIGAGVGAIVGHQHGRRGRGALIGSGIGLMFDLMRWSR